MRNLYVPLALALILSAIGVSSTAIGDTETRLQDDKYTPMPLGVPESISGYPVLAVQTDENFVCMRPGEKRLILQSSQATIEDALRAFPKQRIKEALQALNLGDVTQWGWDIVGPGATREQLVSQLEQSYNFFNANGCAPLQLPITASPAAEGGEQKCVPPYRGFAIIQNLDDNLDKSGTIAQSVYLVAPIVGNNQKTDRYSTFLNNVTTNKDYGLQIGFIFGRGPDQPPEFEAGKGKVAWTDSSLNLIPQPFSIPAYTANHAYYTTISFTSGIWWMCAADTENPATYRCATANATSEQGTYLKKEPGGTNVFAENLNISHDWYDGFGNPWTAYNARIYIEGKPPKLWSSAATWTLDACPVPWPPENAINGSLANDGVAKFLPSGIPPCCTLLGVNCNTAVYWPWGRCPRF